MWFIGAGVYFFAVFHRSSLGVAGNDALVQLDISSTQLGTFVMAQVGIYALMQVPSGLMIDRWGPRKILLAATLLMGLAQLLFALATNFSVAFVARALLGAGDSAVFIAVLRLAAGWFPRRRYAMLTMFTALLGMVGNLIATVPLVAMLDGLGWKYTFAITGGTSLVYGLLLLRPAVAAPYRELPPTRTTEILSSDRPEGERSPSAIREAAYNMRAAWGMPETRLGFWTHQTTLATGTVISLVWGYPYLTQGLGYTNQGAASMLSLYVVANLVTNFAIGPYAGRRPTARLPIAFYVAFACLAGLFTLALWPGGHPPRIVVALVFSIFASGLPASQIGFHLARDYNPTVRVSTATGLVNVGGFSGAMVGSIVVGIVLDWQSGAATPSVDDYRWAFGTIAVISAVSNIAMSFSMLKVRSLVLDRMRNGVEVIVPVRDRPWDRMYRAIRPSRRQLLASFGQKKAPRSH